MVKKTVLPRLDDILGAINDVEAILRGIDYEAYVRNTLHRRAVERCVEIVSEASRHIPEHLTSRRPEIPWHNVRGIGNRLRHEYGEVSDELMWRVATISLPELKPAITALIAHLEREQGT